MPWREIQKWLSRPYMLASVIFASSACMLAATYTQAEATQHSAAKHTLSLTSARYLSNGVYLGGYPGFLAPGHTLTGTYFLPAGADLAVHFTAQPYQGTMPPAKLLINGRLIAQFTQLNTPILHAKIPSAFADQLAEVSIVFTGELPTNGGIKLDSVRTPMNIPLLRINALVLEGDAGGHLLSRD